MQETGKQRATRIPLDYYKRGNNLERWKSRLGLVALLVTLGWLGASFAITRQDDFQASRGPLAQVHQNWDNQCQACHEPFTPISGNSWHPPFLGDPRASSQKCVNCHAGTIHHAGQSPELACASCHRDHRGREASLIQLADSDCTQCHKNLSGHHHLEKAGAYANSVTKFAAGTHPKFRSLAVDPGKLEFNHRLHLSAGMALKEGDQVGGTIKTLGQIPAAFREQYRRQQKDQRDAAPVQLNCGSCHQQDAGDQPNLTPAEQATAGQRGSGAYMLPIQYSTHCAACHPLSVDHQLAQGKATPVAVPHAWQPKEIHEFLGNYFTAKFARDYWETPPGPKRTVPLPGKPLKQSPLPQSELDKVHHAVRAAEKYLLSPGKSGCALCHELNIPGESAKRSDYKVVPPNVPRIWFRHASFNHTAHRAVNCLECHGNAEESRTSSDVLVPGQDNCVKCHAPVTEVGTPGVRSTCTTCHLYHNGDHGMQGLGAIRRRPAQTLTISDFLLGK